MASKVDQVIEIWLIIGLHIPLWRSCPGLLQNTYSLTFYLQTSDLTNVVLIGIQSARYSWQSEVKWNILHSNENAEWFILIIQKHFLPPKGINSANSICSRVSTQKQLSCHPFLKSQRIWLLEVLVEGGPRQETALPADHQASANWLLGPQLLTTNHSFASPWCHRTVACHWFGKPPCSAWLSSCLYPSISIQSSKAHRFPSESFFTIWQGRFC